MSHTHVAQMRKEIKAIAGPVAGPVKLEDTRGPAPAPVEDPWTPEVESRLVNRDNIAAPALLDELGLKRVRSNVRRLAGILRHLGWETVTFRVGPNETVRRWKRAPLDED